MINWLSFLIIGLIAGWIGAVAVRGRGLGLMGDIIIGMIGSVFGGWLFQVLGLTAYGFTGALVTAIIGAVALLAAVMVLKRA